MSVSPRSDEACDFFHDAMSQRGFSHLLGFYLFIVCWGLACQTSYISNKEQTRGSYYGLPVVKSKNGLPLPYHHSLISMGLVWFSLSQIRVDTGGEDGLLRTLRRWEPLGSEAMAKADLLRRKWVFCYPFCFTHRNFWCSHEFESK